ncbi:MAG: hypothetical protein ACUVRP_11440 [Chlorobiales bacterium]
MAHIDNIDKAIIDIGETRRVIFYENNMAKTNDLTNTIFAVCVNVPP